MYYNSRAEFLESHGKGPLLWGSMYKLGSG